MISMFITDQVMRQRVVVVVGFLLTLLLPALAAVSSTSTAAAGGPPPVIRMQVRHTDAGLGLSRRELLQRMALRSSSRAARLLSGTSSSSFSAPVTPAGSRTSPQYLVHLGIGTPSSAAQPVQLTLDTGSDLVWTQCQGCTAATCFTQVLPYFDPSSSAVLPCDSPACQDLPSSWSWCGHDNLTCVYGYAYGDKSTTSGALLADTFVFFDSGDEVQTAVPNISFGCGVRNSGIFTSNETGIAGFGRGPLSLPSQLNVGNFSYCFTDIAGSTPSPVLLGLPPANLTAAAVQTTPMIQSSVRPTFYYLNLQTISVGPTTLDVPASAFALNDTDGSDGGTIIDSGTSFTQLPLQVFSLLTDAFVSQLNMAPVNVTDHPHFLCFPAAAAATMPKLKMQFDGGATLDLPRENYVFPLDEETVCIAVLSSGGNMTKIGNYQQQNMHVIYDLVGNTLSFVPAQCDML